MQSNEQIVNEKYYRCKVTNYGNHGEVSFWYDEPLGREHRREAQLYPAPRQQKSQLEIDQPDPDKETNEERAFRRAKSKVRKLAMTMKADRMLTLTFRENIQDREKANKLLVRFIKLVHEHYKNWKYVCVAELQKRGAWHFHIAVRGFQDVGFLRQTWRTLVDGNIDVTKPFKHKNRKNAGALIASYLTKYMSKAFNENYEYGKYRYRASNGIEIQSSIFWLKSQSWSEAQRDAGNVLADLYGQIGSFYFADDWNNGWFASWNISGSSRANAKPKAIT
jgi:hypothetical protein